MLLKHSTGELVMAHRKIAGFTLIELLVSLAVLGVMVVVAVPGLVRFVHEARMSMLSNQFLADLANARSEAIRRGTRVVLCKSGDGQSCTSARQWNQGWLVFADTNNNGLREVAETRISVVSPQPAGWTIKGTFSGAHYISYHPNGRSQLVSGGMQGGTLTICRTATVPTEVVRIVISLGAGRPRSERTTLPSCT
jgi:type IV fimbrial biogenesis protein FimT